MEAYFTPFRENVIGINQHFNTPYGEMKMLYADWIASGRQYGPIEEIMREKIAPFVANTHTETTETGTLMTKAYHEARRIIKKHVNANEDDVLITAGFGMTGAINKLQRILGFKGCNKVNIKSCLGDEERPVVFITHMEHHSNQTSWYETIADVVIVEAGDDGRPSAEKLEQTLADYNHRKLKIGSFTACSNVTGIETDYHALARVMHKHGGLCFVDFAANAPYSDINMHPEDSKEALDAIFFSPHKFLGGPGSSGVLIFNKNMYNNQAPDHPGGGTVDWTNAWGEYKYLDDIEAREDGGTPGFLQAMRTALAIRLKEKMGTENIHKREKELVDRIFKGLADVDGLHILEKHIKERIGAISVFFFEIHYNLVVKLLNDRFGIQVRGGCSCAGTYGHILFGIGKEESHRITNKINTGDLSEKPGFVRISLHPTMTNAEADFIVHALKQIATHHLEWVKDYDYCKKANEFYHNNGNEHLQSTVEQWLTL
jgi:selenocysteine lyase/cysteine desulfurase